MKPLFAVIDTNVIVSASLKRKSDVDDIELSNPRKIIKYIKEDIIVPIINAQILLEYIDVLSRKELHFREAAIYEIVDLFLNKSIINRNIESDIKLVDEDDVVFYVATLNNREDYDAYLVTGNKKHFPNKPYVVSPREMVEIIESDRD